MVGALTLCAWSYEASITLIFRPSDGSAIELIQKLDAIGQSLNYAKGNFNTANKPALTMIEDKNIYKLYFINKQFRTTFKINIAKNDLSTKIIFSEFGVKNFSALGQHQFEKLEDELAQFFGKLPTTRDGICNPVPNVSPILDSTVKR